MDIEFTPAIGRMVHYVDLGGVHLPATITQISDETGHLSLSAMRVNATFLMPVVCDRDEDQKLPGSWHAPERV